MRRLAWLPALLWSLSGCESTPASSGPVLRRPLSLAMTCASSDGHPIAVTECRDREGTWTSWALDGDARGLVVAHGSSTNRFDADPFTPGWTPVTLEGDAVAVRASSDSDRVVVALERDDLGSGPAIAWLDPRRLVPGMRLSRRPLPCRPTGMEIAPIEEPDGNGIQETVLLPSLCQEGWNLFLVPIGSLDPDGASLTGVRRFGLSHRPLGIAVTKDGASLFVAMRGDPGDIIERIDLPRGERAETRSRIVLVDQFPPRGEALPGCPAVSTANVRRALRIGGPPAPSPDGRFLYVPLESPAGVLALDARTLQVIDVHAPQPSAPGSGNPLLRRLGVRHLPMSAPVRRIVFVALPDPETGGTEEADRGLRAYAVLESGLVVRLVVDPAREGAPLHQIEEASTDIESVATMPIAIEGDDVQALGIVREPAWPSFGMPDIQSDPERPGRFIYYGIRFHGDRNQEMSEIWEVVYEGVIPGGTGCGALTEVRGEFAVFEDPSQDFCDLGVSEGEDPFPGDHLVLWPGKDASCGAGQVEALEYRIVAVEATRLLLEPVLASLPLPPPGCLEGRPLRYEIRASGHWTVVGSTSGFLHNRASSSGRCVPRGDRSPRFTGRALTTTPDEGGDLLEACPVRLGDRRLAGNLPSSRFENPSFSFHVVPGCRIDSRFRPVVVPPRRDQRLVFQVTSGFQAKSLTLGGAPVDAVEAGGFLFVLDAATRSVYQIDPTKHLISASWY